MARRKIMGERGLPTSHPYNAKKFRPNNHLGDKKKRQYTKERIFNSSISNQTQGGSGC
jgi:hypothetical protein